MGHSELTTSLAFSGDHNSLITVGGDGCVFFWSLPRDVTITMETRLKERGARVRNKSNTNANMNAASPISELPSSPDPESIRLVQYVQTFRK